MNFEDLIEFDTKLTADVVEWHPSLRSILACATYQLDKTQYKRLGSIYTLKLNLDDKLNRIESINQFEFSSSGILDMKWLNSSHLITIDSNNQFDLFKYDDLDNRLNKIDSLNLNEKDETTIGLAIDYLNTTDSNYTILTSDTQGYLSFFRLDNNEFRLEQKFKAHDLEVWSVFVDRFNSNLIYSGADDCQFKMWDLRCEKKLAGNIGSNLFEGGVTNILQPYRSFDKSFLNGYSENQILCSSYDERIYVLDKRQLNKRTCISKSSKMGGGVWKMKLHSKKDMLLLACMHYGVNIVQAEPNNEFKNLLYYDRHGLDNLAYGCDWNHNYNENNDLIATCSFYNHELRVWRLI